LIALTFHKICDGAAEEIGVMRQDELERRQQFRRCLAQAVVVAFPRGERAVLVVPDLDLIEAGIVVVAAKIELDQIVLEKLSCQLQCLLWRFGFEVATGVVGRGEKFGAVGAGCRLGNRGWVWRKSSCGGTVNLSHAGP
jgi:hypothetical protein